MIIDEGHFRHMLRQWRGGVRSGEAIAQDVRAVFAEIETLRKEVADAHAAGFRAGIEAAAKVCDAQALKRDVDNTHRNDPVAAYMSGACKCAWQVRALLPAEDYAPDKR